MKSYFKHPLSLILSCAISHAAIADVFISELHYDNEGTDSGEAIELAGPAGTDLTGWQILLYNGSSSQLNVYRTENLSGSLTAHPSCDDLGLLVIDFPSNGIQNGSPDGIALVDNMGNIVEFISYEGEMTPVEGPASGMTSTDIGVSETASTPVGFSLQRDLVTLDWNAASESNFGTCGGGTEPPPPPPVGEAFKIHEIQGSGPSVAITGAVVVEAVVTGDFQLDDQLDGFFIQEEDAQQDGNSNTSEGIFVYCNTCPIDVNLGDLVRITGTAGEFNGMSQITATDTTAIEILSSANPIPSTTSLQLPVPVTSTVLNDAQQEVDAFYEAVEGMLVNIQGTSVIAEYFQTGRFGEVVLAHGERFKQFTDTTTPSEQGFIDHQIDVLTRRVVLDDGSTLQNPSATPFPLPFLSQNNFFRGGDSIENLSGPLNFAFNKWRIQAVPDLFDYSFNAINLRPESLTNSLGNLTIASYNVLNYFTSIDEGSANCAPANNLGCRGADSEDEFIRQQEKLVSALCELDADIIGLMELENPAPEDPITPVEHLVNQLNLVCPGYSAIVTGPMGDDAITVGAIYRSAVVTPIGTTAVLDTPDFLDPLNTGQNKNRPALAQSFSHNESGEAITIVVNHLKSKGSSCGSGDDDTTMGQGNCNGTRTAASQALIEWLETQPTANETDKVLVMGDLNAYRKEDPIQAFIQAGYTDLVDEFGGADAYSFVFDGQTGYLDHALASEALLAKVVSVEEWHINADEINMFDYNSEFKPDNYLSEVYAPNAFRSSDHDPVIIELLLAASTPMCNGLSATIYVDDEGIIVGGVLDGQNYAGALIGTTQDDVIIGTEAKDLILALGGNDTVCALGGHDNVIATSGSNTIFTHDGNDSVVGGSDVDNIDLGDGDDIAIGRGGNDILNGGEGNDVLLGGRGQNTCQNGEINLGC